LASFGRVLHREKDHANLDIILVKARVTDMEAVPKQSFLRLRGLMDNPGPYSVKLFNKISYVLSQQMKMWHHLMIPWIIILPLTSSVWDSQLTKDNFIKSRWHI
jgi:hypothetical protein